MSLTDLDPLTTYRNDLAPYAPLVCQSMAHGANQRPLELEWLVGVLQGRSLGRVLDIGSESGGTLWLWCQIALGVTQFWDEVIKPNHVTAQCVDERDRGMGIGVVYL